MTDIVRPTVRATRWSALACLALPSAFIMWHLHNQQFPRAATIGLGIRIAAVMIAVGLAFTFDDPTEEMTGSAPVSIAKQRALRIVLALPPALAFWLVLRAYAAGELPTSEAIPTASMVVEFVTFAFVAYAGAALGARMLSDRLGGIAGAGTVVVVAVALALLPWGSGILSRAPGTPEATSASAWWWMILAVSSVILWRWSQPPGMPTIGFRRRQLH